MKCVASLKPHVRVAAESVWLLLLSRHRVTGSIRWDFTRQLAGKCLLLFSFKTLHFSQKLLRKWNHGDSNEKLSICLEIKKTLFHLSFLVSILLSIFLFIDFLPSASACLKLVNVSCVNTDQNIMYSWTQNALNTYQQKIKPFWHLILHVN